MTANNVIRLMAALSLSALALGGCDNAQEREGRANSAICINFNQARPAPAVAPQEGVAAVEECIQRWAYSLAPSRDDAANVADAVVAACSAQLTRWNRQVVTQPSAGEGASITTGQPTNPVAEHYLFTQNRALLYVVQARAGRCAPPPAKNGAPEGVG